MSTLPGETPGGSQGTVEGRAQCRLWSCWLPWATSPPALTAAPRAVRGAGAAGPGGRAEVTGAGREARARSGNGGTAGAGAGREHAGNQLTAASIRLSICPSVGLYVSWAVRQSISQYISPQLVHPSIHLSIHPSGPLSICQSISLSVHLSQPLHPYISQSICPSISPFVHQSSVNPLSVHLSVLSVHPSVPHSGPSLSPCCPSVHPSICLCLYLSVCVSAFGQVVMEMVRAAKGEEPAQVCGLCQETPQRKVLEHNAQVSPTLGETHEHVRAHPPIHRHACLLSCTFHPVLCLAGPSVRPSCHHLVLRASPVQPIPRPRSRLDVPTERCSCHHRCSCHTAVACARAVPAFVPRLVIRLNKVRTCVTD